MRTPLANAIITRPCCQILRVTQAQAQRPLDDTDIDVRYTNRHICSTEPKKHVILGGIERQPGMIITIVVPYSATASS